MNSVARPAWVEDHYQGPGDQIPEPSPVHATGIAEVGVAASGLRKLIPTTNAHLQCLLTSLYLIFPSNNSKDAAAPEIRCRSQKTRSKPRNVKLKIQSRGFGWEKNRDLAF